MFEAAGLGGGGVALGKGGQERRLELWANG